MLILHAKAGETIKVEGGDIVIAILEVGETYIKLGFEGEAEITRGKAEQKRRAAKLAKEANHD